MSDRMRFDANNPMFEQALSADAWQAPPPPQGESSEDLNEASEFLAALSRNVSAYPLSEPLPRMFHPEEDSQSLVELANALEPQNTQREAPAMERSAAFDQAFEEPEPVAAVELEAAPEPELAMSSLVEPAAFVPEFAAEPAAEIVPEAASVTSFNSVTTTESAVPATKLDRPGKWFNVLEPGCPVAYLEQFQLLRTQLLLLRAQHPTAGSLRSICVTSANAGEGKSFTARNLAATLAMASGKKVLLVETSAREPMVSPEVRGLEHALGAPKLWRETVVDLMGTGISMMPGLPRGLQPDFEPFRALVAELRNSYEWVIIDGPAINNAASAEWMIAAADATLLVVRKGETSFDRLGEAMSRIPRERLAGVVMNQMAPVKRSWFPRIRIKLNKRKLFA
jgi:Mrp family chromosome partitioning ATPase